MSYPKPSITTNIVVHDTDNDEILLIKRKNDPFKDSWALPGGYFNPEDFNRERADENIYAAALRKLKEETGIVANGNNLLFQSFFDAPGRDPRGRTVSFAYLLNVSDGFLETQNVKASDDAKDLVWGDRSFIHHYVDLAFDHNKIVDLVLKI